MKKICFYLYDGLTDFELTLPSLVVKCYLGYEVLTFSHNKEKVLSLSGITYSPDYDIKSILQMDDLDGIIIPGGVNIRYYDDLTVLIQKMNNEKLLLAAICAGPQYLAEAGVINDIAFTVSESKETLKKNGYKDYFHWDHYLDQAFVKHGHVLTAKGDAFIRFSGEILKYFDVESDVDEFVNGFCRGSLQI